MTPTADVNEIIKLQLKKPKSWNWQLTTSKSSPHIALPTIQLYNSKGKLLLEAHDTGAQRKSWNSYDLQQGDCLNNKKQRNLQRCRSDNLEKCLNSATNKHESINRRIKPQLRPSKDRLAKSSTNLLGNERKGRTDALIEIRDSCENSSATSKKQPNKLRKSRSDVVDGKRDRVLQEHLHKSFPKEGKSNSENVDHRRTRSDDLFRKTFKRSQESVKRAIEDGYRNFITPHPLKDKPKKEPEKEKQIRKYTRSKTETGQIPSAQNLEILKQQHTRYRTRTSSAGTLVISDESFSHPGHRRRNATNTDETHSKNPDNKELLANAIRKSRERYRPHPRAISDPYNKTYSLTKDLANKPLEKLFYSPSDTNLFREIINEYGEIDCDSNSNYIVQEPITPSSRKSSGPIAEPRKCKLRRQKSVESTSSGADNAKKVQRKNVLEEKGT